LVLVLGFSTLPHRDPSRIPGSPVCQKHANSPVFGVSLVNSLKMACLRCFSGLIGPEAGRHLNFRALFRLSNNFRNRLSRSRCRCGWMTLRWVASASGDIPGKGRRLHLPADARRSLFFNKSRPNAVAVALAGEAFPGFCSSAKEKRPLRIRGR
jgi:hypothetical protein